MNKEKIETYALASIGFVQGVIRYYVVAPLVDLVTPDELPIMYSTNAEIDERLGVE